MRYFLLLLFLFSCSDTKYPETEDFSSKPEPAVQQKWVCYHPKSRFHDKECVEGIYPDGCYVVGDNTKFCWSITRQECFDPQVDKQLAEICLNVGFQ